MPAGATVKKCPCFTNYFNHLLHASRIAAIFVSMILRN
jgi:hypothetical protein